MARSTKEEALETRNRILDAAVEVFYAKGTSATSLADVAEAAGVTRGAIYWHFKNKSDLFDAMCERVRLPMEAMTEAGASQEQEDPLGQLRASCIFVLRQAAADPQTRKVFEVLFHKCEYVESSGLIQARQQEAFRRGEARIERILRNAITHGQLAPELDVHLAATALHAAVIGLVSNWLFAKDTFNLEKQAERLIDASIDMLRYAPSLRKPASR
ncbi:transcriptional regulator, TetR family [Noviherbaspirillum humi]|uniref:Transcriptional regulator, TetR family n=1 Tax=Noviherbaspirillum humi TaxID=1688639 RepID=A0A239EC80_9BURK|nr:TetR family transcriptional regulator [Noviherbaspirillum humi]SNS42370.1 transcriptional regulator, TetR family [Noviherbaspirillum humi]